MDIIGEDEIYSFKPDGKFAALSCFDVRSASACNVKSFVDLAKKIARLQFSNPNYVLLFRGQQHDFRRVNKENKKRKSFTSLRPGIFRPDGNRNPIAHDYIRRFSRLNRAERLLLKAYERKALPELDRLKRHQILRWSILQHYEVCPTPLLDVTHSLRIAASFASEPIANEAFVFVVGVPNLSGAITASAEAGLQIIRLSSVCPPQALRPHIQEGYLLGQYPEIREPKQKQLYKVSEVDFGRRLIAKFRFDPSEFWTPAEGQFPKIPSGALYPNKNDPLYSITQKISAAV